MTNRGAAVIGLRLLALYFFIHSLTLLPQAYGLLSGGLAADDAVHAWPLAAACLVALAASVLLWFGVRPLVAVLLPQRTVTGSPAAADPGDWYAPAFAAVGLLVTIEALPAVLRSGAAIHYSLQALQPLEPELVIELAVAVLRLLLGLVALLGSRGLAGLIVRLRTGGLGHAVSP